MKSLCNHTTPIYNEKYVVERLLTTIAEMDYPKHLLEKVLDDSTDDSVVETEALIHKIAQVGLDIKHIRRSNRTGYAGALKEGLLSQRRIYCYF
jgi:glycosyltransferase involved in cell wall biosynthesis